MAIAHFPWLTLLILLPLVAALAMPFLPIVRGTNNDLIRWYAVSVGWLELALICYVFWAHYDPSQTSFQIVETFAWIPALGLNWTVSLAGLSAPFVLLAGLVPPLPML